MSKLKRKAFVVVLLCFAVINIVSANITTSKKFMDSRCAITTFVSKNMMSTKEFIDSQGMSTKLENIVISEKASTVSVSTLNGTGYVFNIPTPVANIFLAEECRKGKRVIDIGCGFNYIPIKAIENGVSEYVANDISKDHLSILAKKAVSVFTEDQLTNLKILCGAAPSILTALDGKYDAVLADKVIHFFSPSEIKDFINLAKARLNSKGRIYATVSSIYGALGQNDDYKVAYQKNLNEGKEFPGYFTEVFSKFRESGIEHPDIVTPEQMVLFSKSDLENLFSKNDMKVVHSCSLKVNPQKLEWETVENEGYDNYSDFIEIIAEKIQ